MRKISILSGWTASEAWRKVRKPLGAVTLLVLAFLLFTPSLPKPVFEGSYSTVVLARDGSLLRAYLANDEQWRLPLSKEGVPPKLKEAVLSFEDKRFYQHPGFDPFSILRAIKQNVSGSAHSGASTLTMQVARLALPKERTFWSKLIELKHALVLEWRYSKDDIFRLWLGHTPYGGNLVGAETAARRYFGVDPWQLSWAQAAFLATLPKSPNLSLSPKGRVELKTRRDRLLLRLKHQGHLSETERQAALAEDLPRFDYEMPFDAPHASELLRKQHGDQVIFRTTLDPSLQKRVEANLKNHAQRLKEQSVFNVAALVVDNESGAVVAYVGSQDFDDKTFQGEVDGVIAERSSGSILKPFLYAQAMDQSFLVPQTKIPDVPTHFGAFTPTNHDNSFDGEVTMAQALIRSKNVPAVRTLADIGVESFYHLLKDSGLKTLFREPNGYGLSLILGGAEVRLWDLAAAYRMLARRGVYSPIYLWDANNEAKRAEGKEVLSPGAALSMLSVMKDLKRPGSEYFWRLFAKKRNIAWKTGTSYGHRDAWAVGTTPQWTVAVWAGNFSGVGRRDLWGSTSAAPILFDLFGLLPEDPNAAHWFSSQQGDFQSTEICEQSGLRANEHCPHKKWVQTPQSPIPLGLCHEHQHFFVEEGEGVCSLCWQGEQKDEVRLVKSPEINAWLRYHGQSPQEPPKHRPSCPTANASQEIAIVQPNMRAVLLVPKDAEGQHLPVVMRAAHQREDSILYWYLDERYLGKTQSRHEWSHVLSPGKHELRVVDERGGFRVRTFQAQWSDSL